MPDELIRAGAGISASTIGARSVNPSATVHVAFTSTWFDPATERQAAEYLLRSHSVRLIAQHQDGIEPQLAAQRHGLTSIGYNSDMALHVGDSVLVSLQFEWAEVYAHFAKQLLPCDGPECARWVPGEQYWPSYSKGGFSLTQISWKVRFRSHSALLPETFVHARMRGRALRSRCVFGTGRSKRPCGDAPSPIKTALEA